MTTKTSAVDGPDAQWDWGRGGRNLRELCALALSHRPLGERALPEPVDFKRLQNKYDLYRVSRIVQDLD